MAQYSFPILENDELLPCLDEMEIPLTATQLAKPTFEIVSPLFESMLINLTGITREELNQPLFAAIDVFEFPELHDESIAASNFLRHINKLLQATGVKEFSMKDIYKPESARLRRQLSAIVNFAKFREEKLVAYTEMQQRIDQLAEEQRASTEAQSQYEIELKQLQEARAAEEAEASSIKTEAQELHQANQQLNKQYAALHSEVKSLKAQSNQLADQAQAEKFELMNAKQENEKLQDQIVQSPEKFQRSVAELQAAVEAERGLVEAADRRCRDQSARKEMVNKVEKEVLKCLELMREVEVEVGRKKGASRKVKDLKGAIAAAGNESADLEAQQQHFRRQMATLSDRIKRLESQAAVKKEALESSLDEQMKDKEAVEAENAAQACMIQQHDAATRVLQEKVQELRSQHQAEVAGVVETYCKLRSEVAAFNRTLAEACWEGPGGGAMNAGGSDAGQQQQQQGSGLGPSGPDGVPTAAGVLSS